MAKRSLSKRVFATMLTMSLITIVVFALALTLFMQKRLVDSTSEELASEARVVAASLNSSPSYVGMLRRLQQDDTRITLVGKDGDVLYDTDIDESKMEDHGDRPEIEEAFETGSGSSDRASSTLGEVMLYEAVRLADGSVVRLAKGEAGYLSVLWSLAGPVAILTAVGVVVSVAWRAVNPVASSSRCSRWTLTIPSETRKTPTPKWSPCWSVLRPSAKSSSARCVCSPTMIACAASSRRT